MLFLLARMFYADGLVGSLSALWYIRRRYIWNDVLGNTKFGIAMNIFAGLGAFVFAWVED